MQYPFNQRRNWQRTQRKKEGPVNPSYTSFQVRDPSRFEVAERLLRHADCDRQTALRAASGGRKRSQAIAASNTDDIVKFRDARQISVCAARVGAGRHHTRPDVLRAVHRGKGAYVAPSTMRCRAPVTFGRFAGTPSAHAAARMAN